MTMKCRGSDAFRFRQGGGSHHGSVWLFMHPRKRPRNHMYSTGSGSFANDCGMHGE